jgi:predicted CopG family antitoxin
MQALHYLHVMSDNKKLHTIAIDKQNYEALRNLGYTGESFNTVINRLISSSKRKSSHNANNEGGNEV